ncbi:hypothetical protein FACS189452_07850 [Bacteroidia bacterium]|nr:hypothetical protein FACS189452_07850 [Bacteroidia bacterium]GHT80784.1 hypothetical protein FACS189467_3700 [Bacteroidia bacterium]
MEKIAFIINPIAGGKNKEQLVDRIAPIFPQTEGYGIEIYYTQQAGDAEKMSASFVQQGFTKIIAVGGDGTVNEVARALVNTEAAMGIIPYGSGNGLARHLNIPLVAEKALSLVKSTIARRIDTCTINDMLFVCTAGVGFDALISHRFAADTRRGITTYIKHVLKEVVTYRPKKYRLTIDGKSIERTAFLITFANAAQWGNNAYIAPHADISDGLIDVVIINDFEQYKLLMLPIKLMAKRIDTDSAAEVFRCRHAIVEQESEDYAHFDGESTTMGKRMEIKIFPNTLKVMHN